MLTAKYTVALTAPLHTTWLHTVHMDIAESDGFKPTDSDVFSQENRPIFHTDVDAFRVTVELVIEVVKNPLVSEHNWTGTQTLKVALRSDVNSAQELIGDSAREARNRWNSVCRSVVDRTVDYCRYVLGYPFLRNASGTAITHEGWFNDEGELVAAPPPGPHIFTHFPGMPGTLGSRHLTKSRLDELRLAVSQSGEYSVQQEILAQAREAIYEEQNLKAVLLLAIASEVAIKTKFFREDSLAAVAFDYLEEKRQVEISPPELIERVAKRAFGVSFKEHDAKASKDIEHLFRCRNKVAHRARAEYKDDAGVLHQVTRPMLHIWWNSVETLLNWLSVSSRAVT